MLILRLAWRNIWRNRRRTVITTLSIVIAVFLSAVTRSSQEGQYENMIKTTVGTFSGYIQIHKSGYWDEPMLDNSMRSADSLLDVVQNHRFVDSAVPRIESYALAAGQKQSRPVMVMGIDVSAEKNLSNPEVRLKSGSYFSSDDENSVIIGSELMKRLNVSLGDSVVLLGAGFRGMTASGLYPVRGTVSYPNPELNSSLVLIPLETAQTFFAANDRLTSIALILNDPNQINQTVSDLQEILPTQRYEVMDWRKMMPELVQAIQADRGSGIIILLVLYIVVGFGILGTVLMMIKEREYEFGVMLSIGTSRMTLARILAIEVVILTFLGSGIGIVMSIPVVMYFNLNPIKLTGDMSSVVEQYGMEPILSFSADPTIFTSQAVTVFIVALVFSLIPVIRAANLNPIQAMRD